MFGVAYVIGGVLTADPVAGFPPGTTAEMVHTWHGAAHNVSRSVSTLLLLATSAVMAVRFAPERRRAFDDAVRCR